MFDFFHTNWASQQIIERVWPTDVSASFRTDAEDRRALTTKPRRVISMEWVGLTANLSSRILFQLARSQTISVEIPLYPDHAEVTGVAGAVVTCDTTDRRFFAGKKIVIVDSTAGTVERGVILSLTPTDITLTAVLTGTYGLGSQIFPIIDAQPKLLHEGVYRHDQLIQLEATFKEQLGPTALPSLVPVFGDDPLGFPSFQGLPILDMENNWRFTPTFVISRTGTDVVAGKGNTVSLGGLRPIFSYKLEFSPLTRAETLSLLEFFDSRRGRCLPFWLIPPQTAFTPVTGAGPDIVVEPLENILDISDFMTWFAVIEKDGTIHIRDLSSVSTGGGGWILDPFTALPAIPLADIARVTMAHKVRFSSDSMEERWRHGSLSVIRAGVTELTNEKTVEVTDL